MQKKKIRRNFRLLAVVLLSLLLNSCYYFRQAKGQLSIRFNQVPIKQAIAQETNPHILQLLKEVPKITAFGTEVLKLKPSANYTDYYRNDKPGISFVVTAAPKLQLKAYQWSYLFVGKLPFRGYFEEEEAVRMAAEMEAKGYDTYRFAAPAYSTLGWFKDPITTNMLNNGLLSLANTILHEMAHVTFYQKNEGDFNESVASFVGSKGAELYVLAHRDDAAAILSAKEQSLANYRRFTESIEQLRTQLNSLYASAIPDAEKLARRAVLFDNAAVSISKIYPKSSASFRKINNARIMQISRYREDNPVIAELFEFADGDWSEFWRLLHSDTAEWIKRFKAHRNDT